jgi:hypothetical protein
MAAVVDRVNLACERAPKTEIGVLPGGSFVGSPRQGERRRWQAWL